MFRVESAPVPLARAAPPAAAWWPGPGDGGGPDDVRSVWSPAAFALSTPAGFSHSLRQERSGISPPVQAARPGSAYLDDPRPAGRRDRFAAGPGLFRTAPAADLSPAGESVFPPRSLDSAAARMEFPDGWESRLFSGIDLTFGAWAADAWTARVEWRFDARGVPISTLLTQPSGIPEVDRRLARSANGWRLLEPTAPREGVVGWNAPASAPRPATDGEGGAP